MVKNWTQRLIFWHLSTMENHPSSIHILTLITDTHPHILLMLRFYVLLNQSWLPGNGNNYDYPTLCHMSRLGPLDQDLIQGRGYEALEESQYHLATTDHYIHLLCLGKLLKHGVTVFSSGIWLK